MIGPALYEEFEQELAEMAETEDLNDEDMDEEEEEDEEPENLNQENDGYHYDLKPIHHVTMSQKHKIVKRASQFAIEYPDVW